MDDIAAFLKDTACKEIEKYLEGLKDVSLKIWNKPELGFEEKYAHDTLTDFLESHGFIVQRNSPLETSFIARFAKSDKGPRIGIMCEYDALPEIGHACGHNLIAEAGLAAALGLKAALLNEKCNNGQVVVYGTPGEEGLGGKVHMLEKGSFEEVDVCLIVHPAPVDIVDGSEVFIAREEVAVTYTGKAAHAAASPWEGINALDAAVACYNAVSMMRQKTKPDNRIHGIFTDAGIKPNIIPQRSQLLYYLRAPNIKELAILKKNFDQCARGAAEATGCEVTIEKQSKTYFNVLKNKALTNLYQKNVTTLGLTTFLPPHLVANVKASTDVGNVSYYKPTIHPVFSIPANNSLHTVDFQKAAGRSEAQAPTIRAGKAMAMTGVDIICNSKLLKAIDDEFDAAKKRDSGAADI